MKYPVEVPQNIAKVYERYKSRPTEAQTFIYEQLGLTLNRWEAEYLKRHWDLAVGEWAEPPD